VADVVNTYFPTLKLRIASILWQWNRIHLTKVRDGGQPPNRLCPAELRIWRIRPPLSHRLAFKADWCIRSVRFRCPLSEATPPFVSQFLFGGRQGTVKAGGWPNEWKHTKCTLHNMNSTDRAWCLLTGAIRLVANAQVNTEIFSMGWWSVCVWYYVFYLVRLDQRSHFRWS